MARWMVSGEVSGEVDGEVSGEVGGEVDGEVRWVARWMVRWMMSDVFCCRWQSWINRNRQSSVRTYRRHLPSQWGVQQKETQIGRRRKLSCW